MWGTVETLVPLPPPGSGAPGVPCAARPTTGFRHLDGACQCFVGGPAPTFPPAIDPAARADAPVVDRGRAANDDGGAALPAAA